MKPFHSTICALSSCDTLDALLANQGSNFELLVLPLWGIQIYKLLILHRAKPSRFAQCVHPRIISRRQPKGVGSLTQLRLSCILASGEGTSKSILRADTVNPMSRVKVFDDNHLVTGGHTFARGDDGPGEEQLPNLK